MGVTVGGVLHGARIDLEEELPIPDGTAVLVHIERKPLTTEERRRVLAATAGAWASDSSLDAVFDEIARRRRAATPRRSGGA